MSFREKSAWISLVSIFLVSLLYFLQVPWSRTPPSDPRMFHGLLLCVGALIVIQVLAHVVVAIRSPKDARTPKDERERAVDLKAVRVAYWLFVIGAFASVFQMHHGANRIAIGYGVLLAFVIAQLVNFGARIVYYRRGF